MKKLLVLFALMGIIFVSGCTQSEPTGMIIAEDEEFDNVQYHEGTCTKNTDCLLVHCEYSEQCHCMNTVQVETEMKCNNQGRVISEKDYEKCGCNQNTCQLDLNT